MAASRQRSQQLPNELQDVATTGQLNDLEAHLSKSYSSERYEEFQAAVEKIVHKELTTDDAKKKLNAHIDSRVEVALKKRWWRNWGFWTTLAATAAAITLAIRG